MYKKLKLCSEKCMLEFAQSANFAVELNDEGSEFLGNVILKTKVNGVNLSLDNIDCICVNNCNNKF